VSDLEKERSPTTGQSQSVSREWSIYPDPDGWWFRRRHGAELADTSTAAAVRKRKTKIASSPVAVDIQKQSLLSLDRWPTIKKVIFLNIWFPRTTRL
jgi:hypothetical protein